MNKLLKLGMAIERRLGKLDSKKRSNLGVGLGCASLCLFGAFLVVVA